MACTVDYIDYVCDNIRGFGIVTNKKMFGEYMIYINAKPILLVCDNTVYVKMKDEIAEYMKGSETGFPYSGAKEHYILDVEDRQLILKIIPILVSITPIPKKKGSKK